MPHAAAATTGPGLTPSPLETPTITPPPQAISPPSGHDSVQESRDLSTQVRKLEAQIETLTQREKERDALLLKVIKELETLRSTKKSKAPTPPPFR